MKKKINEKTLFLNLLRYFKILFWDISGLRNICAKIYPPAIQVTYFKNKEKNKEKAPTFFLWVVGIYFTMFGFAYQNYERQMLIFSDELNFIQDFQIIKLEGQVFERLQRLQKTVLPVEPKIAKPIDTIESFFGAKDNKIAVSLIKSFVEKQKFNLGEANLSNLDLSFIDLTKTRLYDTSFLNSNLEGVNFTNSILRNPNFTNVVLKNANFTGVRFTHSICHARTLKGAKFDDSALNEIKQRCSELLI